MDSINFAFGIFLFDSVSAQYAEAIKIKKCKLASSSEAMSF